MGRRPDFILIGAMKAGTSTLHDQLAGHPGFFLSTPKEPCFFSDDDVWARGFDWYEGLFAAADRDAICGESSTHYTKRPTLDKAVTRLHDAVPDAKLIYLMRHPVDRLISHYMHEWSEGNISTSLDEAVEQHRELVDYGRYSYQLAPYREAFGAEQILPVFLERHLQDPAAELARVLRFLGCDVSVREEVLAQRSNVSGERMKKSAWRDRAMNLPGATWLRRTLLSESVRERIKSRWRLSERPALSPDARSAVEACFDEDLAILGSWLGVSLTCDTFRERVSAASLEWRRP